MIHYRKDSNRGSNQESNQTTLLKKGGGWIDLFPSVGVVWFYLVRFLNGAKRKIKTHNQDKHNQTQNGIAPTNTQPVTKSTSPTDSGDAESHQTEKARRTTK
jgi:hypothetical protein